MKAVLATLLSTLAPAFVAAAPAAAPVAAPQQLPPAWFPDVYNCRCYSQAQNLAAIQPLCSAGGGGDMTVYPPGNYVWCTKTSTKSAPRVNRLAGVFTDEKCQAEFGAGFKAECRNAGYELCQTEAEECHE